MPRSSSNKQPGSRLLLGSLLFVFFVSTFTYGQYGFNGLLTRDDAIYLYSGQQMAEGIPPYVSIFDHKGPLAPMLSGVGVILSEAIHTDDIVTVRAIFLVISSLTVVSIYLLMFILFGSSYRTAFLTSFVFVNFWGFGRHAASGPRAKTPMVLFETLAILLTARRMWFWAGLCGSLAFLTWQPTIVYPLITFFLAATQSIDVQNRVRNLFQVILGFLLPVVTVSVYFLSRDAFLDFVDGFFLFNVIHLDRPGNTSVLVSIFRILSAILMGYPSMSVPIILGLAAIVAIFLWRLRLHGNDLRIWLSEDPYCALLLSSPLPLIWSLIDFQAYPDFYIFLPYAAIGFGWLMHRLLQLVRTGAERPLYFALCVILIVTAAVNYRLTASNELELQKAWAEEISFRFGDDSKLISLGVPEAMVLLHRTNPNPYLFLINGIDNRIDANTAGGFSGWLSGLQRDQVDVILYGPTNGRFKPELEHWLERHYQDTMIGSWEVYVALGNLDQRSIQWCREE